MSATDLTSDAAVLGDSSARAEAIDATQSFIVQAPAGSGKTELLIQRMLSLLIRASHPSEILAITFTKKAAGEMRERLLNALRAARDEAAPIASPARERYALAKRVLERDEAQGWKLLARPALLNIDTFDAFSLRVARCAPVSDALGNVALAQLQEDATLLYREAARRALLEIVDTQHLAAVSLLLETLDNRVDDLIRLLASLLGKRAQWMTKLIDDSDEAIAAMQAMIESGVAAQLKTLATLWPSAISKQLNTIAQLAADMAEADAGREAAQAVADAKFNETSAAEVIRWVQISHFLLTGDGSWRKLYTKSDGFPAPSEKGVSADEKEIRKNAKDAIAAIQNDLQLATNAEALRATLASVRSLPDAAAIAAHEPMLRATLRILKIAAAELALIEQARALTDFSGVALAAQTALAEYRDEVYGQFEASIAHVLIDEFQDTSPAQSALVESLIDDWQPGDGRTLFLVGDPMQSIYAFRDADVGIFTSAWNHGIGPISGERLQRIVLSANYRSQAPIVEWVNRTMGAVFATPAVGAATGVNVPFAAAVAQRGKRASSSAPSIECFATDEEEVAAIVTCVASLQANASDETIAILVRNRAHAAALLREFSAANIAFSAREMAAWADRPLIRDLLSLTYVLAQPIDRLSWFAWLRSPMIGLSLDAFAKLGERLEACDEGIRAALRASDWLAALNEEDRARAAHASAVIDDALHQINVTPLANRVHRVFLRCGGERIAVTADEQDEVADFLSFLEAESAEGFLPARAQFEAKLKKQTQSFSSLGSAAESVKPVEVLTMHKAKGLEWDHVFIPRLDWRSGRDSRDLVIWDFVRHSYGKSGETARLLVAAKESRKKLENSVYDFVRARKSVAAAEEAKRLLYVALTRARESLTVSGSATKPGAAPRPNTLAALLEWPTALATNEATDSESATSVDAFSPRKVMKQSLSRLPLETLISGKAGENTKNESLPHVSHGEAMDGQENKRRNEIALGIVGHKLIEGLAATFAANTNFNPSAAAVRAMLASEGAETDALVSLTDSLLAAVTRMKTSEHFAWIHATSHTQAANELPIEIVAGGGKTSIRLDRTFVDQDGVRWIVDYKFSSEVGDVSSDFLTLAGRGGERAPARQTSLHHQHPLPPSRAPSPPGGGSPTARYREQLAQYAAAMRLIEPQREVRTALYFPFMDRFEIV